MESLEGVETHPQVKIYMYYYSSNPVKKKTAMGWVVLLLLITTSLALKVFVEHCLCLEQNKIIAQNRTEQGGIKSNTAHLSNKCNKETNEQQVALETCSHAQY